MTSAEGAVRTKPTGSPAAFAREARARVKRRAWCHLASVAVGNAMEADASTTKIVGSSA
jgi:hypothetical protein